MPFLELGKVALEFKLNLLGKQLLSSSSPLPPPVLAREKVHTVTSYPMDLLHSVFGKD